MADIKVVIQLQDTKEDEINSLGSSSATNNASITKANNTFQSLSTANIGTNLKSWATGSLSLSDGYVGGANTKLIRQHGYNGYVFGAVPESKQLTVTLEVVGKNIDSIIVYGDKIANQFPTKAYRDGNPNDIIYSDDPVWAIKFAEPSTSHTITFLEWNRANYNACITYVAKLENKLYLDKSWIKSVESLSQSTGQPRDIYYGVVPNSGSAQIYDVDGEFSDMIRDGIIPTSDLPISIYANGKKQQSHIVIDSNYANDKVFTIENSNFLSKWGDFKIKPKVLKNTAGTLMAYFRNMMREYGFSAEYVDSMCTNIIRDGKTAQEIMELIRIPYQYHKCNTLLDFVNEICKVCHFCLLTDEEGNPKFVDGNPSLQADRIIRITPNMIVGSPTRDIIVKNKVQNIKYLENSFQRQVKDICNQVFYFDDLNGFMEKTEGNLIIEGEGDDSVYYLHFFVECSENASEFIWKTTGVTYPFTAILEGEGTRRTTEGVAINELDNTTKEEYDFSEGNCCELTYYRTLTSKTFGIRLYIGSLSALDNMQKLTVSIVQDCYYKVVKEKTINDLTENVYELGDSTFLSTDTTYNNTEDIYSYNNREMLANYKDGVSVANVTISCGDMYDVSGNKVKDWANGEILSIGDVVRIDADHNGNPLWAYKNREPIYWKVTGRNFRKVGVPMIDLELQEVRAVQ